MQITATVNLSCQRVRILNLTMILKGWLSLAIVLLAMLRSVESTSLFSQDDDAGTVKRLSDIQGLPERIAFGSCAHQDKPQPVLETVAGFKPDLFIYLGDNIYGDTRDMEVLQAKYAKLGSKPEFKNLRQAAAVLAIWDDHDYGENDAGNEYPFKAESRNIFLDFWRVPDDDNQRQNDGIYGAHRFEKDGMALQVILLDTRTFRDPLKSNPTPLPTGSTFKNAYQPDENPSLSLLGEAQWTWLAEQLAEPADLRIICSSIQFGHEYNGWESWTNLPLEQQKMFDLIQSTKANGVIFISGDVHWGEISKRDNPDAYAIYDVTASGITETWPTVELNKFRIGEVVRENHFGMIDIDWTVVDPIVTLKIIDRLGTIRLSTSIRLSELRLKRD